MMPPTTVRMILQPCCLVIVSPGSVGGDGFPQSAQVNSWFCIRATLYRLRGMLAPKGIQRRAIPAEMARTLSGCASAVTHAAAICVRPALRTLGDAVAPRRPLLTRTPA